MPAPQASMMQQLARLQFSSFKIKVPVDWENPSGDVPTHHYFDAFSAAEHLTVPDAMAPPLFLPASPNKYHTGTQKDMNKKFGAFIDGVCSAICSAWGQWQSAATLIGVIINGPVAAGGQVVGPPLGPLILAGAPKGTAMEVKFSNAIANTIGTGWLTYTSSIKVPGLPWYPAFAAFPAPVAPPMPNIPIPLIALTQVPVPVSKDVLKAQMIGQLGDPKAQHHKELFDAIADAFDKCFKLWQASTMVTNVLGTGPIPTFAPPYVPVGPVLAGVGNMTPGGFV
jgi:hypothetical protein